MSHRSLQTRALKALIPTKWQLPSPTHLMSKGVTTMCLHWIGDKRSHQMIACLWLSSKSRGICNQCLAQMKKLAGFVCLSAVSGPQLSFGSRELPINNKYVVHLPGQEPAAYVLLFLKCGMRVSRFSWFDSFDLCYKTQKSWGQGHIITFFQPGERFCIYKNVPPAFKHFKTLAAQTHHTCLFSLSEETDHWGRALIKINKYRYETFVWLYFHNDQNVKHVLASLWNCRWMEQFWSRKPRMCCPACEVLHCGRSFFWHEFCLLPNVSLTINETLQFSLESTLALHVRTSSVACVTCSISVWWVCVCLSFVSHLQSSDLRPLGVLNVQVWTELNALFKYY